MQIKSIAFDVYITQNELCTLNCILQEQPKKKITLHLTPETLILLYTRSRAFE